MQLQMNILRNFLNLCLEEDYGIAGDITSFAIIGEDKQVEFSIKAREKLVLSGLPIVEYYLSNYSTVKYQSHVKDSDIIWAGSVILSGKGRARDILLLERVMLNFLQHMSGISTLTSKYVKKVEGTGVRICDTRKTTPMLRKLQKYAVFCGGGYNHRLALDSSILIKDNHIAICGGVRQALHAAKRNNPHYAKIEIECDTIEQVKEAIDEGVDIIMLDNMSIEQITKAIEIIDNRAVIEVSGGVNLETVEAIAKTGVNLISTSKLTTSAAAVDIGLDING